MLIVLIQLIKLISNKIEFFFRKKKITKIIMCWLVCKTDFRPAARMLQSPKLASAAALMRPPKTLFYTPEYYKFGYRININSYNTIN